MDRRFVSALLVSLLFVTLWIKVLSPGCFRARRRRRRPRQRRRRASPRPGRSLRLPRGRRRRHARPRTPRSSNRSCSKTRTCGSRSRLSGATLVKAELLDYAQSPYGKERLDLLMHYAEPSDSSMLRVPRALELRDPVDAAAGLDAYAWRIESSDATSVTFLMEQGVDRFASPYRIRKKIKLPEAGRHAEVTLTLEYLGSGVDREVVAPDGQRRRLDRQRLLQDPRPDGGAVAHLQGRSTGRRLACREDAG